MKKTLLFYLFISCMSGMYVSGKTGNNMLMRQRAKQTLDSIYSHYSVPNSFLLKENYPFNEQYTATYLADGGQKDAGNAYSYLWPYSGSFSAVDALYHATKETSYKKLLDRRVLPGLEEYFDSTRKPFAYSSYINSAAPSDRFYDDNIWLGIDFTDLYASTGEKRYLEKAKMIWKFIESGTDNQLGGGIYWCEAKKGSKNTCSNAPGTVLALKLFKATGDSAYFRQGKTLYEWTKAHLQDAADNLYFDNIGLDGKIGREKYSYNSGQMLQAASLLYQLTGKKDYLTDARAIAKSCYNYFFIPFTDTSGEQFRLMKKGDVWFTAVMLRGFVELYRCDKDAVYLKAFKKNLDYAWEHARDDNGLFNTDWSGKEKDARKWLLTQCAMVEMYAGLPDVK